MSLPSGNRLLALAGRFTVAGMLNTGAGFFVIFALMYVGVDPFVSNAAGYGVGLLLSFGLHKGWVYQSKGRLPPEIGKYTIAVAASYALNLVTLALLIGAGVGPYLAQALAAAVYTGMMFLLSTYWVFSDRAPE